MNPSTSTLKVVIVEDNASLNDIYKTRLEMLGYQCFSAYDGEQALSVIETELPNLVLLDLMVPKIAGDQILATMRAHPWGRDIKVLVISNLNEADAPAGLREHGIVGYAVKANLSNDDIDKLVDDILKPAGQDEAVDLDVASPQLVTVPADEATAAPTESTPDVPASEGDHITTFLTFASGGAQAIELYTSVFKNSKTHHVMTSPEGHLLHASFELSGKHFMAMDGGPTFSFADGVSLFVSCNDQAEVDYYWDALTANGGTPGRCGWLKDPYGVSWQIIPTALGRLMMQPNPTASGRVMEAMLKMNKLDIAALEQAAAITAL